MSRQPGGEDQPAVGEPEPLERPVRGAGRRTTGRRRRASRSRSPVVMSVALSTRFFVLAQEEVADHGDRLVLRVAAGQRPCRCRGAGPRSARPPAGCGGSRRSPATASGPRRGTARSAASPARGRAAIGARQRTAPSAIDRTSATQRSPSQRYEATSSGFAIAGIRVVARGRRVPALLAGLEVEPAQRPCAIDHEQRAADPADEQLPEAKCSLPSASCATGARRCRGPAP